MSLRLVSLSEEVPDGTPVEVFPGLVYWQGHMILEEAWSELARVA